MAKVVKYLRHNGKRIGNHVVVSVAVGICRRFMESPGRTFVAIDESDAGSQTCDQCKP